MKIKTITVTSLNKYLGKLVKANAIFSKLSVEGEVSNIRISKSGYTYFTLSDDISSISCIYFGKDFDMSNGDKVVVHGRLNIYEVKGTCQIVVNSFEMIGIGNVLNELKKLKEKLKAEGAFDDKKNISKFPSKIGIITSHSGAALQDALQTFRYSEAKFELDIYNSLVQGKAAIKDVVEGIKFLNNMNVQLILITRGGGSFEDLDVFNSIDIAEAILLSKVPIITGIGHETDITIADYVADKSLHTPTAAANYLCQRQILFIDEINKYRDNCEYYLDNTIKNKKLIISENYEKLILHNPRKLYNDKLQDVINMRIKLENSMRNNLDEKKVLLDKYYKRMISYDLHKNLKSGFSIVLDENKEEIVKSYDMIEGKNIRILMNKCEVIAEIKKINFSDI